MPYISIIIAFIIGYYFGNREQAREDIAKIKGVLSSLKDKITPADKIRILQKKEPKPREVEVIEGIDKNNAL